MDYFAKPSRRNDDALALLCREHERAQDLYEGFQTAGGDDRYFLASRLLKVVEHHSCVEEEFVYPVIQAKASKLVHREEEELIRASLREHRAWRRQLARVKDLLVREDGYQTGLEEFMEEFRRHAAQEEQEVFPIARTLLSEAELMQVAEDIRRTQQQSGANLAA